MMNHRIQWFFFVLLGSIAGAAVAGGDPAGGATQFTNRDGIKNTRHNLTQSTMQNNQGAQMNSTRNDYGEVCVYCHTPHGTNTTINAPLWNRTTTEKTFQTYNELGTETLTQTVSAPGANSLTCLSCHDGQTAIDSIINMPGSGRYNADQMTSVSDTFLNSWPGTAATNSHRALNDSGCLACHQPTGLGTLFPNAPDFRAFVIGTDLRNDHPVGITFPVGGPDFKVPNGNKNGTRYFDVANTGHMDANEIRVYDTGDGPEVECASCHDPHGVPSAGPGSDHIKSFLRVNNQANSGVCLTCHDK